MYGRIRKDLAEYLHELARQKECKILEGHLCPDHVHMLMSIPPKYSVAQVMGFIKGKSAIHVARTYLGQRKNSLVCIFGHEVTTYRLLEQMKSQYESKYETRARR